MDCSTPGFPVLHCLPKFAQTPVHWVNDAIQPSHPLSPPPSSALNLPQHQALFQGVSSSHQVAKVLETQLQHQSFQSGLMSFRINWFYLLASQGTLKSPKVSILGHSDLFMVQLSHPYMNTGKTTIIYKYILYYYIIYTCKYIYVCVCIYTYIYIYISSLIWEKLFVFRYIFFGKMSIQVICPFLIW